MTKKLLITFFDSFNEEYNNACNQRLYPDLQERVKEYIKGLPSCFSIDYSDYNIEQAGKSWGYCQTGKQRENFINNWFSVIAFGLIQLKEKLN